MYECSTHKHSMDPYTICLSGKHSLYCVTLIYFSAESWYRNIFKAVDCSADILHRYHGYMTGANAMCWCFNSGNENKGFVNLSFRLTYYGWDRKAGLPDN